MVPIVTEYLSIEWCSVDGRYDSSFKHNVQPLALPYLPGTTGANPTVHKDWLRLMTTVVNDLTLIRLGHNKDFRGANFREVLSGPRA